MPESNCDYTILLLVVKSYPISSLESSLSLREVRAEATEGAFRPQLATHIGRRNSPCATSLLTLLRNSAPLFS